MIGYRSRKVKLGARRVVGVVLASSGLFCIVRFLSPEMWVSLIGLALIGAGWSLFKN